MNNLHTIKDERISPHLDTTLVGHALHHDLSTTRPWFVHYSSGSCYRKHRCGCHYVCQERNYPNLILINN